MSIVISVENLSKLYHLGLIGSGTFRDDLRVWWAKARGKPNPLLKIGQNEYRNEEIWALKDVSFRVEQGEVLGIIGKNGAGKSTLLKILSRTTAPTSGKIKIKGRIASLLEVGTGFHPELTGRENVYLNGAILGMTRREIDRKFDEIVDFSGVEKFIDTPVKRYSSGMYVRLAFAVAAHLEPEILVVDEVLAVGDAEFQKKCLGKMSDVASEGRTVLYVSHNMTSIEHLCPSALLLQNGQIAMSGETRNCISHYFGTEIKREANIDLTQISRTSHDLKPTLTRFLILDRKGKITSSIGCGESIEFRVSYSTSNHLRNATFGIMITTPLGAPIFFLQTRLQMGLIDWAPKNGELVCKVNELPLIPGEYFITLGCSSDERQVDLIEHVTHLTVEPRDYFQTGYLPHHTNGSVLVNAQWTLMEGKERTS